MLLKSKQNNRLVQVNQLSELLDPYKQEVMAQIQAGQNEQPAEPFKKVDLIFPSGENLPQCWLDSNYRSE
ncbi:MAG: acetyltransferase [Cyanobacteria bacterium J06621_8]